jgi:hypothetical protein
VVSAEVLASRIYSSPYLALRSILLALEQSHRSLARTSQNFVGLVSVQSSRQVGDSEFRDRQNYLAILAPFKAKVSQLFNCRSSRSSDRARQNRGDPRASCPCRSCDLVFVDLKKVRAFFAELAFDVCLRRIFSDAEHPAMITSRILGSGRVF